mmetsp:Transcript_99721/g.228874  ORF Transcript_99721/g.228874 Transcript_99721/m.228874 type:complete len:439 (-) Transcript_99721:358-1674(-)
MSSPPVKHLLLGPSVGAVLAVLLPQYATQAIWAYVLAAVCACLIHYRMVVAEIPQLFYDSSLHAVVSQCEALTTRLWHTPWALNAHVQAVLFAFHRETDRRCRGLSVTHRRELVKMSDGGQVALDWAVVDDSCAQRHDAPIVLMIPGIVGKQSNPYLVNLTKNVHVKSGGVWRTAVKSWRGIDCAIPESHPRPECWDMRAVLDTVELAEHIRRANPKAPIYVMGFSVGGNIAVAAAAHPRGKVVFKAGAAISAPFDLEKAMGFLEKDQWFPYSFVNTRGIVDEYLLTGSREILANEVGSATFQMLDSLLRLRNLIIHPFVRRPYGSTWHENVTCRFTGHETPTHYYTSVVDLVKRAVAEVQIPFLCMLSDDDSVTPSHTFEHIVGHTAKAVSPSIVVVRTARGGHCGWFRGPWATSWVGDAVYGFLNACRSAEAEEDT